MPIVRPYPISEVSPQPMPNVAPSVPAAGEIALFGGNRARDLQLAGQNLGQASDSLFALYQREAKDANDTRVQDLNNRFIDDSRTILKTGPDGLTKVLFRSSWADRESILIDAREAELVVFRRWSELHVRVLGFEPTWGTYAC